MSEPRPPNRPEELTPQFLSNVLGACIDACRFEPLPSLGMTSRTGRLWLEGDGPRTLFVKFPDPDISVLPGSYHLRELAFLEHLAPHLEAPMLRLHFGALDGDGRGVLLLEDLVDGVSLDPFLGCDEETAAELMPVLAEIHARTWGERIDWLPAVSVDPAKAAEGFAERGRRFVETYADQLRDEHGRTMEALAAAYESIVRAMLALPRAVVHADLNPDNLMRAADGRLFVIDWQLASVLPAVYDAAGFLGNSLSDDAVAARPALLALYGDALRARGVALPQSELERQFRLALAFRLAVVTGSMGARDREEKTVPWVRKLASPSGLFAAVGERGLPDGGERPV